MHIKNVDLYNAYEEKLGERATINIDANIDMVNDLPLGFEDCVIEGNKIWFSAVDFNGIFVGDLDTGVAELLDIFPDEPLLKYWLYIRVIKKESKLVFFPYTADKVVIYDLDEKRFTDFIKLPHREDGNFNVNAKAKNVIDCGDIIYIFGMGLTVYEFYWNDKKIMINEKLSLNIPKKDFSDNYILDKENVIIPVFGTNMVCKFNLLTQEVQTYSIGHQNYKIIGCESVDEQYWFCGEGLIILCDKNMNLIQVWDEWKTIAGKRPYYWFTKYGDGKIHFFDNANKGALMIDIVNGECIYTLFEKCKYVIDATWKNYVFSFDDKNKYFIDMEDYGIFEIGKAEKMFFTVNKDYVLNEYKKQLMKGEILSNEIIDEMFGLRNLDSYLQLIINGSRKNHAGKG